MQVEEGVVSEGKGWGDEERYLDDLKGTKGRLVSLDQDLSSYLRSLLARIKVLIYLTR